MEINACPYAIDSLKPGARNAFLRNVAHVPSAQGRRLLKKAGRVLPGNQVTKKSSQIWGEELGQDNRWAKGEARLVKLLSQSRSLLLLGELTLQTRLLCNAAASGAPSTRHCNWTVLPVAFQLDQEMW